MLIPAPWRRPAWLVIGSAMTVVVVLSLLVAGHDAPTRLDRTADPLARATLDNPVFDRIDVYFQQLGDLSHLVVLLAVVTFALLLARRWSGALLVATSTVLTTAVTKVLLKPLVDRHYYDGVLSFPSTHVASVSAVMIATSVVLLSGRRPGFGLRVVSAVTALAIALTSRVAVVAERTHYTTDTIAGWCVAAAVVLGVALVIDRFVSRQLPAAQGCNRSPGATDSHTTLQTDEQDGDGELDR